jgi:hypothetical protein
VSCLLARPASTNRIDTEGISIMTVTTPDTDTVIGGIDTHLDTIHVAVIDSWGRDLADQEFPTTPNGYRRALDFLTGHGPVATIGIEGTSSYARQPRHDHQPHGTRPLPQHRARYPLPSMAYRRLTPRGAAVTGRAHGRLVLLGGVP